MNIHIYSPQSSEHGGWLTRRSFRSKSILAGIFALACAASQVPAAPANGQADQVHPIVDTQSWLRTVTQPPAAWKKVLEGRDDVLRHRFVRFQQPHSIPSPRSSFVVHPFHDTKLTMHLRRANPVGEDSYSWFGIPESDPMGWGGFVVRANGKISMSINANGKRYEVVNVSNDIGNAAYAVLELAPREPFKCLHDHPDGFTHSDGFQHNFDIDRNIKLIQSTRKGH